MMCGPCGCAGDLRLCISAYTRKDIFLVLPVYILHVDILTAFMHYFLPRRQTDMRFSKVQLSNYYVFFVFFCFVNSCAKPVPCTVIVQCNQIYAKIDSILKLLINACLLSWKSTFNIRRIQKFKVKQIIPRINFDNRFTAYLPFTLHVVFHFCVNIWNGSKEVYGFAG